MTRVLLSLGSNLGDRGAHLRLGVAVVAGEEPHRLSRVYRTAPVGGVAQDDFWNLALALETSATPADLLERVRAAEAAARRVRAVRWGPRTLDVDVLWIDGYESDDPELTVPHPRMWERAFVMVPLAEIAPDVATPERVAAAGGEVSALGTLSEVI